MKRFIPFLLLVLCAAPAAAEIAVMPFRVANPSEYLKESSGEEYAKILSTGALLTKKIDVFSPEDLVIDMKRSGITSDSTITAEYLNRLGKSLYVQSPAPGNRSRPIPRFLSTRLILQRPTGSLSGLL